MKNCVLIRKSEKKIIRYLIDCAGRAKKIFSLSPAKALSEIESWKDETTAHYFIMAGERLCREPGQQGT